MRTTYRFNTRARTGIRYRSKSIGQAIVLLRPYKWIVRCVSVHEGLVGLTRKSVGGRCPHQCVRINRALTEIWTEQSNPDRLPVLKASDFSTNIIFKLDPLGLSNTGEFLQATRRKKLAHTKPMPISAAAPNAKLGKIPMYKNPAP